MKFGKQILKAQHLSTPDWQSFWLDYKTLKGLIKDIKTDENVPKQTKTPADADASQIDPQGVLQELGMISPIFLVLN